MKKRGLILLVFLAILHNTILAQNKFDLYDFHSVDSFAKTVKYEKDIFKLAKDLTSPYSENIYKVRSIFRWITENIGYDYEFVNKGKEPEKPDCSHSSNCAAVIKQWEDDYIKDVLKNKKGVCSGYAKLFKRLCDLSGVQSEVIDGYIKNKPYQIGNTLSVNHAWNAVMVDSVWYYVDPTWASGWVTEDEESGKLLKFTKEYKNYYWLTPFSKLVRNHYPKNGRWVEKTNMTKEDFFNLPHYYNLRVLENISNEMPVTGMLSEKEGDTIHFSFDYKEDIKKIQINTNNFKNPQLWYVDESTGKKVRDTFAMKKQAYIPFTRTGDTYKFDYVVNENSLYYIELLFDYKKAMRYRVQIKE
jgi:hypothetical protein